MDRPLPAGRTRWNSVGAWRRCERISGNRLAGRDGHHRDDRRFGEVYCAAAYVSALRWSYRRQDRRHWVSRVVVATLLALRSVAINQFSPAELIDSVAVRP